MLRKRLGSWQDQLGVVWRSTSVRYNENVNEAMHTRVIWKWSVLPLLAIAAVALIPQIHFCLVRGAEWHGSYATQQGDEFLYSAYINALIDGRPRRNDPATGQDDRLRAPLPESLFSVQFIPSYVIAFMARMFGASASTAFIFLMGLAGVLAGLAVFWLLASVTGDSKLAASGVLVVLCLGALVAGQGWIGIILRPGATFSGLPFLRRYLPAAPFPLFFVFCTLIWQALTASVRRSAVIKATLAGITLAALIFSYFYLWTAAVAWFFCILLLWFLLQPDRGRNTLRVCIFASLPVIAALAYYFYLLSGLPDGLNQAQVLTLGHWPDFWRVPAGVSVLLLILLTVGIWRRKFSLRHPVVILASSFALLPLLIFNQQIVSGRSIQSYHYEIFIANYTVLIALVILVKLFKPDISKRTMVFASTLCFLWGVIEVNQPFLQRSTSDVTNDKTVPVLLRLKNLAKEDGTFVGLGENGKTPLLVFSPTTEISKMLPTWAPQGSLLAIGSVSFQSQSRSERKAALYTHLYYCGKSPEYLHQLLNGKTEDSFLTYYTKSTLFGPERVLAFLGPDFHPITDNEVSAEVLSYQSFLHSFSREHVLRRPLGYAITPVGAVTDFSHIDRWYQRGAEETIGSYNLYRLKLRH